MGKRQIAGRSQPRGHVFDSLYDQHAAQSHTRTRPSEETVPTRTRQYSAPHATSASHAWVDTRPTPLRRSADCTCSSNVRTMEDCVCGCGAAPSCASRAIGPSIETDPIPAPPLQEHEIASQVFQRRVKKLVEVPTSRKVKVPTTKQTVVPSTRLQNVPTKKLVQEQSFKWIDEQYTDYEEREATRMKEIWVKKLIPEPYKERIPIQRTRRVKVPCTVTREIDAVEQVRVPTTALVDTPAYRIDEIVEHKTVEVEGVQNVELVPRVVDEWVRDPTVTATHGERRVQRVLGQTQYDPCDDRLRDVDSDMGDDDPTMSRTMGHVVLDGTERRVMASPKHSHSHRKADKRAMASYRSQSAEPRFSAAPPRFGFVLQNSVQGLMVQSVDRGSVADAAGIGVGDVVMSVNNTAVSSNREWRSALGSKTRVNLGLYSRRQGRYVTTDLDAMGMTQRQHHHRPPSPSGSLMFPANGATPRIMTTRRQ